MITNKVEFNKRVGLILKKRRREKKYTQLILSKKIGIDQSTFSRIEGGELELSFYQWSLLTRELNIELYHLREIFGEG